MKNWKVAKERKFCKKNCRDQRKLKGIVVVVSSEHPSRDRHTRFTIGPTTWKISSFFKIKKCSFKSDSFIQCFCSTMHTSHFCWEIEKISMKPLWNLYETCMKPLWNLYETTMKSLRNLYETSMKSLWNLYETSMKSLWNFYETSMKSIWNLYETSMKSQWNL